jgi:hypothetical protein
MAFPFNKIALLWIFGIVDSINPIGRPRSAVYRNAVQVLIAGLPILCKRPAGAK